MFGSIFLRYLASSHLSLVNPLILLKQKLKLSISFAFSVLGKLKILPFLLYLLIIKLRLLIVSFSFINTWINDLIPEASLKLNTYDVLFFKDILLGIKFHFSGCFKAWFLNLFEVLVCSISHRCKFKDMPITSESKGLVKFRVIDLLLLLNIDNRSRNMRFDYFPKITWDVFSGGFQKRKAHRLVGCYLWLLLDWIFWEK